MIAAEGEYLPSDPSLARNLMSRGTILSRHYPLSALVAAITEPSSAVDYALIRPLLLSIPSYSNTSEFFRSLIIRYHEEVPGVDRGEHCPNNAFVTKL